MSAEGDTPASERPKVPSPEAAAETWRRNSQPAAEKWDENTRAGHAKWLQNTLLSGLARIFDRVDDGERRLARLADNLDHLHDDVIALRERANVPRPECYPPAPRPRVRARRARQPEPPAPPAPGETFPTEPGGQSNA